MMEGRKTEGRNDSRTRQIQYSPFFSKGAIKTKALYLRLFVLYVVYSKNFTHLYINNLIVV